MAKRKARNKVNLTTRNTILILILIWKRTEGRVEKKRETRILTCLSHDDAAIRCILELHEIFDTVSPG
jgi:hypothetical protein